MMYSAQKTGAFAVVEARNVPCPMEWGCPKDRSMTVSRLGSAGEARPESSLSDGGVLDKYNDWYYSTMSI